MRGWYRRKTVEERRAWVARRDPEKVRAVHRRLSSEYHRSTDPTVKVKRRAREQVAYALRVGRLVRGACAVGVGCDGKIEAHHEDYDRPLDVTWLCTRHHAIADGRAV